MQRKALICFLSVWVALASQALAETVDEIVSKNIEAKGGKEAWLAVKTARMTGVMQMSSPAGALDMPFTIEIKRPEKVRMEFTMQGMTGIQAYDGETGWAVMPFLGKPEAEEMAEDQLKDVKEMTDSFGGELLNYEEKGHTVELVGSEEVDGTPAYKLKVVKANGDEVILYLDQEYYVEFKLETTREVQGMQGETAISTVLGDYKEVDGLMFAHSTEISFGGMGGQVITISKVELDVDIADERFTMPEPKPSETETEPETAAETDGE